VADITVHVAPGCCCCLQCRCQLWFVYER